jgi:N,N'-diacetylbacillosaminyl-diphospho-undecaprenol alpha-1,3-N-acetylgalactosaminyltransferase
VRVALVLNDDFSMWHFFRGLITALLARGIKVLTVTPPGPYAAALQGLGATHAAVSMPRFVSPAGDIAMFFELLRVFRREAPDVVCNITVKPIVYGALAARLARVPTIVGMVEGLGYGFLEGGNWKARILRTVVSGMYRVGFGLSHRIGFANPDDRDQLVRSRVVFPEKALAFRSMVGVDVKSFAPGVVARDVLDRLRAELGIDPAQCVVAMVTRVVWSKGVKEFVEASEEAAAWPTATHFLLVGPIDADARDSVPEGYLRERASSRFTWVSTFRSDLKEILSLADVVALPSYYREGVPRVLLEAMALGKPIVTTDNVGCREAVDPGRNGHLVPVHDSHTLAEAIRNLVENEPLRQAFGRESRSKAEAEFSETAVVDGVLTRLLGIRAPA